MINKTLQKEVLQKPQLIIILNMITEIFIEESNLIDRMHTDMGKTPINQAQIITELNLINF